MRKRKAVSINVTKERVIVLVKLCITLSRHTGMTHDDVHSVGNMNLHLSSAKGTLIEAQTVIEIVGDARCVRAAHLTLSCEGIQNFVLCVSAEAPLKVD